MEGHWKAQDKRRLEKLDFILFRDKSLTSIPGYPGTWLGWT